MTRDQQKVDGARQNSVDRLAAATEAHNEEAENAIERLREYIRVALEIAAARDTLTLREPSRNLIDGVVDPSTSTTKG